MHNIININKNGSDLNYSLSNLTSITTYLDSILNQNIENIDINDVLKQIKNTYDSMFFSKAGLSEFYIWDEDFERRLEKNKKFEEVKEDILKLLVTNHGF